ncbi:hypothetical protein LBMAG42_30660 [Deltaproteobacteria bacterium]|nr:hypothetical protein LBMAG42_30660 [Deltaproteobacteria bacterium]
MEWRGGQAQLAALLQARPDDLWAGAAAGALAARVRPPDLALIPDAGAPNALRVRAAAARFGVDLVAAHSSHAHDASLLVQVPLVVHRRNHRPPGHAWKYRRAASVIAVSEFVAALCRRAGIARVAVVHDGADGWPRPARPPNPEPVFLVPAALVAHKGHAALLEAFKAVPGILELAGEGPLRAELEALARPLGARVRFLGRVLDMGEAFGRADVVVLPSRDEAGGSVLIEAMASGVPVVASAVGGIPELVGEAGALVRPDDRRGWVDALNAAPGRDSGPGRIQAARFSVAAMVRGTEQVYRA